MFKLSAFCFRLLFSLSSAFSFHYHRKHLADKNLKDSKKFGLHQCPNLEIVASIIGLP